MGEEVDPLAESLLKQRQNKRERGVDIIPTVVHQLTEEIQFLAARLQLHRLA